MKADIVIAGLSDILFSGGTAEDTCTITALKEFVDDIIGFDEEDGQLALGMTKGDRRLAVGYHMELCVWTVIYSELDPKNHDVVLFESSSAVEFPMLEDHDQWSSEQKLFERLVRTVQPQLEMFFGDLEVPEGISFVDLYRKPRDVSFTKRKLKHDYTTMTSESGTTISGSIEEVDFCVTIVAGDDGVIRVSYGHLEYEEAHGGNLEETLYRIENTIMYHALSMMSYCPGYHPANSLVSTEEK